MGKASTRAHNKYIAKAYDRVNLTLPKGQKEIVQAHASTLGESVNGFIGRAIFEAMERDSSGNTPGGPSGVLQAPSVAGVVSLLETAQRAAEAAGQPLPDFIRRAVETQAQRDKASLRLGINPVTGDKPEKEA